MPRDLPISNGSLFVSFDKEYRIRELCFPFVGEENHVEGELCRFGMLVGGNFEWVDDTWNIERRYLDDTLVTAVSLSHPSFPLKIEATDCVDFEENIYFKKMTLTNCSEDSIFCRLFFCHDFHILGNDIGDTAEFRPDSSAILHYKKDRYFLISGYANGKYGIDSFTTGNIHTGALEGSWKDAEDGVLSENPITQGSVDSVIALDLPLLAKETKSATYWIACGKTWEEVKRLHLLVKKRGPDSFFLRTQNYWKLWLDQDPIPQDVLPPPISALYRKSLLIARAHMNPGGSIIAGVDSDVMQFNRDTYSYMWPRDGSLIAHALDLAGYNSSAAFYKLCGHLIEKEGYFLHKYNPSGSLASSWHPWFKEQKKQLPIQEDGTALILWALGRHFTIFHDIELMRLLYDSLIKKGADFLMTYRNLDTGLPLPSYDLWEERRGILTFTTATVFGGLVAAARFAEAFGDTSLASEYREGAALMRKGMDKYLYLTKQKRFARMITFDPQGKIEVDDTVDASLYATFAFGAYAPDEEQVRSTMAQIEENLQNGGGIIRYPKDPYYRSSENSPGNPWFITTLWLAQYKIAIAKEKKDLQVALSLLEWVASHALPSGVLAEQIDPETHAPLSVSPLTWSHAAYVITIEQYLQKLSQLDICPTCRRPLFLRS